MPGWKSLIIVFIFGIFVLLLHHALQQCLKLFHCGLGAGGGAIYPPPALPKNEYFLPQTGQITAYLWLPPSHR